MPSALPRPRPRRTRASPNDERPESQRRENAPTTGCWATEKDLTGAAVRFVLKVLASMTSSAEKTPVPEPGLPARHSSAFFGAFPSLGIWSPLGLHRGQFFVILAASLAVFAFFGGPAWRHLHDPHLWRIGVSYAVIPVGVAIAYAYNGDRHVALALAAVAVIALIKLVATALLLMAFALAAA